MSPIVRGVPDLEPLADALAKLVAALQAQSTHVGPALVDVAVHTLARHEVRIKPWGSGWVPPGQAVGAMGIGAAPLDTASAGRRDAQMRLMLLMLLSACLRWGDNKLIAATVVIPLGVHSVLIPN